jgi:prephenate dehydrogenase
MSTVAVLGYGRFGTEFCHLLLAAGHHVRVFDPGAAVPAELRKPSLEAAISDASLVMAGVPVGSTRDVLISLRPLLTRQHTVFDVGSVKMKPAAAMREILGKDIPWAATHPLFGPVSLARGERPLRVVVCPNPWHPAAVQRVEELYEMLGCEVIEQVEETHDRVMAETHALAFFIARGLLQAGTGIDVPFSPPSFQAIRRLIDAVQSDAGHLFDAIERENPFASEARHRLLAALEEVDRNLEPQPSGVNR